MRVSLRLGMSTKSRVPIHSLPLPKHGLTDFLTPDPLIKSPDQFLRVIQSTPSIQRRSRPLAPDAHFSFVSPLPIQFPYRIDPPAEEPEDRAAYIEHWLGELEPKEEDQLPPGTTYRKFSSPNRNQDRVLIGLSETGLQDCLPNLDVGDAFSTLGSPSLSSAGGETAECTQKGAAARRDLIDVLSGHSMLVAPTFAPWSLRYSGHQFGVWAGQLGDGRAISVRMYPMLSVARDRLIYSSGHPSPVRPRIHLRTAAQRRWPYTLLSIRRRFSCRPLIDPRILSS